MKRRSILLVLLITLLVPMRSYAVDIGSIIGSAVGGVGMLAEAAKTITPGEEHYIGRAVAAVLLSRYSLYNNAALTKYVNKVGLLDAYASKMPATYGGYHFAVLNSEERNAYACPGGLIFINKGLLKDMQNEDQLSAVLAHEVAHVADRDGIDAIKRSKWTKLGFYAAGEVGRHYTPSDVASLVGVFQSVVTEVSKKVLDSGYSKGEEKRADRDGLNYMWRAGYNPDEMITFFKNEEAKGMGTKSGPFSSHPKMSSRVKALSKDVSQLGGPYTTPKVRVTRFKKYMAGVR